MFWLRSYLLALVAIGCVIFGAFLSWMWWIAIVPFSIMGIVVVFISIALIQMRGWDSGLGLLYNPDETARGQKIWAYIYGDDEIEFLPGIRTSEKMMYCAKNDQQTKVFKSYRCAGKTLYLIPEGVGHSVDLLYCLYATIARDDWKVRGIQSLRKLYKDEYKPMEGGVTTIGELKKMSGVTALPQIKAPAPLIPEPVKPKRTIADIVSELKQRDREGKL